MTTAKSFEDLLNTAYPNPGRVGCLSSSRLRQLAENPPEFDDPAAVHVCQCSPCFAEFAAYRDARRNVERRAIKLRLAAAFCFVLLIIAGFAYWRKPSPNPALEIAQLDFSTDTAVRGVDETAAPTPQAKASAKVLEIALPAGAAVGMYDVELRGAANMNTALAPAQTVSLQRQPNGCNTLSYRLAAPLPPASYVAAWRIHGSGMAWRYGSFEVKP